MAGSYDLPFALCIGMAFVAALLIVLPPQRNPQSRAISIH
jgi:hypothetical protein